MSGASQHYIPASFLGRFSPHANGRLRERPVWVLEAGHERAQLSAAEEIGCEDNLYQLYSQQFLNQKSPSVIDDAWARYEQRLGPALDELAKEGKKEGCLQTINAKDWLRVLVPFVASLFVRGKEFSARYGKRMSRIYATESFSDPEQQSDNTNVSRIMEFQRLLAPVMSARWLVMHTQSDHPVITNELGFTLFRPPDSSSDHGIAIPIGPRTILGLVPTWPVHGRCRCILKDRGTGQWRAVIEHGTLNPDDQRKFNGAMASIAQEFLVGPTAGSVEIHRQALDDNCLDLDMLKGFFWPNSKVLRAHEFEWHRVVTATSKKSSRLTQHDLQHKDWDVIAKDWFPQPVIFPVNLRDFPSGLLLRGDKIYLAMTEVPGFTDGTKNSPYVIRAPKTTDRAGPQEPPRLGYMSGP